MACCDWWCEPSSKPISFCERPGTSSWACPFSLAGALRERKNIFISTTNIIKINHFFLHCSDSEQGERINSAIFTVLVNLLHFDNTKLISFCFSCTLNKETIVKLLPALNSENLLNVLCCARENILKFKIRFFSEIKFCSSFEFRARCLITANKL